MSGEIEGKHWQLHCETVRVPVILWSLHDMLYRIGLAVSKTEAVRLIKQGAVEIIWPGNKVQERQKWENKVALFCNGCILKVGKRRLAKMKVTEENCTHYLEVITLPEKIPPDLEELLDKGVPIV